MEQSRLAEAIKIKNEMSNLISSPGWKRLIAAAGSQVEGRTNSVILEPTKNPYEQEYLKGEIHGIKAFMQIPSIILEESQGIIDLTKEKEEESE